MKDLPIACTLSAADLQTRLAEIGAVGRAALRSSSCEGATSTLRFVQTAATRRRLEEIIAAESQCCSFLGFALADEGDEIVLTITAPPGAEPVGRELAGAFAG